MLITNFSSGELSETLSGRLDISQYHRGAALMDNFDVIPTGGIKRRGGMERLLPVQGQGRLIPFAVNRDLNFLLYLAAGAIQVLRVEGGRVSLDGEPITGIGGKALYADEEICGVQYAQNHNTLILVHENHPPLEVKFVQNNIILKVLQIDNEVNIKTSNATEDEIKQKYPDGKKDSLYEESKYLRGEGSYPRCVTFFNGRLVFAGTKNNPQRVFASKILLDEDKEKGSYPFATYDFFATKQRKYVSLLGKVNPDNTKILILENIYERFKFTEAELNKYRVDSPFYSKDTRIIKLSGDILELSEPGQTVTPLMSEEETELKGKKTSFENYNNNKTDYGVVGRIVLSNPQGGRIYNNLNLKIGASEFLLNDETEYWPNDVALQMKKPGYLTNRLIGEVTSRLSTARQYAKIYIAQGYDIVEDIGPNVDLLQNIAMEIFQRCEQTMKYDFRLDEDYGKTMHGKPFDILTELQLKFGSTSMYVTFYTEDFQPEDHYPTPDCGFTFEVASDMNDAIRWLVVNKGLIIGTETSEWVVPPGVNATSVQAVLNSRHGSDRIQGTAIGDATCFFQAGGKALVEYRVPEADNHFRANNMAMLAPQMLRSRAKEFDFASAPYTRLYVTREDGVLATLLYERNTGTFAWNRVTTGPERIVDTRTEAQKIETQKLRDKYRRSDGSRMWLPEGKSHLKRVSDGMVLSVAVLPGPSGFDDVYLLVSRPREAGQKPDIFLERLREDCTVYLDSHREWKWADDPEALWLAARARLIAKYAEKGAIVYDPAGHTVYDFGINHPGYDPAASAEYDFGLLPPMSGEGSPRYIGCPGEWEAWRPHKEDIKEEIHSYVARMAEEHGEGAVVYDRKLGTAIALAAGMPTDGLPPLNYDITENPRHVVGNPLRWERWEWTWEVGLQELIDGYGEAAVVYDAKENKAHKPSAGLPKSTPERPLYVGYPYTSVMRSMPVQNKDMSPVNIRGLSMRFHDSFMPGVRNKDATSDSRASSEEPFSGVTSVDILDGADTNAWFEIYHDRPTRCCVLSVYAEA